MKGLRRTEFSPGALHDSHESAGQFVNPVLVAALDRFDMLSAVVDWVEKGVAPDRVVATGAAFPGRSRPLCPYPQHAQYSGHGDQNDAGNFVCQE